MLWRDSDDDDDDDDDLCWHPWDPLLSSHASTVDPSREDSFLLTSVLRPQRWGDGAMPFKAPGLTPGFLDQWLFVTPD